MKSAQDVSEKNLSDMESLKQNHAELKKELDLKNEQMARQVAEIKELSQEKSQLAQNVSELELIKIELQTKAHSEVKSDSDQNETTSQSELLNLIKVCSNR